MRLTLRTLLAYRDGVLSQADHDDLHRRIQQSPDAGNLLRRIQELTSNSQVLTPKLESTGLAGPNLIAEYLDDVLTSSRIAELERLFLEYNEHLCELAHCHQVIAQALHTHVEIPDSLRQTALALINPDLRAEIKSQLLTQSKKLSKQFISAEIVDQASSTESAVDSQTGIGTTNAASSTTTKVAASVALTSTATLPVAKLGSGTGLSSGSKAGPSSPQQAGLNLEGVSLTNEVPEYLRGSRKRRWMIPVAIVALTGTLILLVWQSIGSWDELTQLMRAEAPQRKQNAELTPQNNQAEQNGDASSAAQPETPSEPSTAVVDPASLPAAPNSDKAVEPDPSSDANAVTNSDPTEPLPPIESDATKPTPPEINLNEADVAPISEGSSATMGLVWNPTDDFEQQSVVLLQTADSSGLLAVAAPPLKNGKLIVPPVARATLDFGPWKWLAVGPSVLEFEYADGKQQVRSSMCRALLSTASPGQPLVLKSPQGDFEIRLLDQLGWIGIEIGVRRVSPGSLLEPNTHVPVMVLVAGIDGPSTSPQLMTVKALADNSSLPIESAANGVAIIGGKMEAFALQSPPSWYRKKSIRAIDLIGISEFRKALLTDSEPIIDKLRKLSTDPRPELASLAIQTSLLQGDWQPWVKELLVSDRMRSHWNANIHLAQQVITENPQQIQELKKELQLQQLKDSDKLVDLLLGLDKDVQNIEGLQSLVKGLDANNSLPIRVLSAYQLKSLTGEDFGYQPHAPVKSILQQWRSKLSNNKLGLLPVTDPIVERNAKL